jgi:RNA polymerase sigma factor FliA
MLGELDGLDIGSLQMESSGDAAGDDLCEYLPGDPEETPYCLCLKSEMRELLAKAIQDLPAKEQQVLSLYYFEELTMKEVGAVLGVGESRVSQIHSMAMLRLRGRMKELTRDASIAPSVLAESAGGAAWKRF